MKRAEGQSYHCRRCSIIRWFLFAAGTLLGLMLFVPGRAEALGPVLPDPLMIGLAFPVVGIPVFIFRYIRWRRAGRL